MNNKISVKDIKGMLAHTQELLPGYVPREAKRRDYKVRYPYGLKEISATANAMATHFGLDKLVIVTTADLPDHVPARIFLDIEDCFLLELDTKVTKGFWDKEQILCLLAHELAHAFIAQNGLGYNHAVANEFYTDFIAVYAGFGWAMTDGCKSKKVLKSNPLYTVFQNEELGYLNIVQLYYIRKLVFNRPRVWELDYWDCEYEMHPKQFYYFVGALYLFVMLLLFLLSR